MGKNAVLERVNISFPTNVTENNEVLVLVEKVIEIMNKGFGNLDTRFQLMEEQLDGLKKLLEQMGA